VVRGASWGKGRAGLFHGQRAGGKASGVRRQCHKEEGLKFKKARGFSVKRTRHQPGKGREREHPGGEKEVAGLRETARGGKPIFLGEEATMKDKGGPKGIQRPRGKI